MAAQSLNIDTRIDTMTEKLLDTDNDDTIRMSVNEAKALGVDALAGLGYTLEEAGVIATHLVDAATWGYEFAGLPRILVIAERQNCRNRVRRYRSCGNRRCQHCSMAATTWATFH